MLVALVIFVFLRTFRASIIPIITIPVSLVGSFALMALAGFTINTLTLLALVLAIGLVVDDAIVMLENIFRHIEEGLDPFSAAIKGAREIGFAVITMTATLVAVYAPLAFTPGPHGPAVRRVCAGAGRRRGGVGLCGADADAHDVFASCSSTTPNPTGLTAPWSAGSRRCRTRYGRLLRWMVTARWRRRRAAARWRARSHASRRAGSWWASWRSAALALVLVFPTMKQELSPLEDRGTILASVNAPDGATLDYTNRYAQALEKIGNALP